MCVCVGRGGCSFRPVRVVICWFLVKCTDSVPCGEEIFGVSLLRFRFFFFCGFWSLFYMEMGFSYFPDGFSIWQSGDIIMCYHCRFLSSVFSYCFIDVNDSFSFVNEQDWAAALGRIQLPGEYISPYVLLFLYEHVKGLLRRL